MHPLFIFFKDLSQNPVKGKPLNLNQYTGGNSPQPLTTEVQGSSQEVGEM